MVEGQGLGLVWLGVAFYATMVRVSRSKVGPRDAFSSPVYVGLRQRRLGSPE